jgi:cytochrome oxidase assembly protein ShyY1
VYRFLLSRQWVILTLVSLLLIPAFIRAGNWQYHRHEQRVERNELIAGNLAEPPVDLTDLAAPGRAPDPEDRFRTVTATGRYDPAHEVVVRQRTGPEKGALGYYVLTPLVTGPDGPVVLVNRGWIPAGNDPTRMPDVPAPPSGELTVSGRLMADETSATTGIRDRGGLPDGMVMLINSEQRAEAMGASVVTGHIELTATDPDPSGPRPEVLPDPNHSGIGAHFAYALQWWLFTAFIPLGWFLLFRRELQDRRAPKAPGSQQSKGPRPEPRTAATGRPAAPATK